MTTNTFSLEQLSSKTKPATVKKAPAKAAPIKTPFQASTPWGREFMKRLDALHKALDGEKLA